MGKQKSSNGINILTLLFLLFLGLKLSNVINWSWWWITAPIWGEFAFCAIGVIITVVYRAFKKKDNKDL